MRKVLFILGQLTDEDVEWLARAGSRIHVPPGTKVIEEGKAVEDLFIVLDGKLSVSTRDGGEIAQIGSGEIVGEMSFIDQRPPAASVTAIDACHLLRLSRTVVDARVSENPRFAAHFYKAIATFLSDRLRGTVSRLGFGKSGQVSDEEMDGELDLAVLENVHLAGARFDRMLKRLSGLA